MRVHSSIKPKPQRWAANAIRLVVLLAIGLGTASACSGDDSHVTDFYLTSGRARTDSLSVVGLNQETHDLDGNGQPDQWTYTEMESGELVRAERDIDFDGRIDLYEYYDANGAVVEEEMHLDFDDQIDVIRFYRDGIVVRRELAIGFDGRFTMVKYYDATGNILRVERDTDNDNRIDTWEYFEGGEVVRVGRDLNEDGRPEVMDRPPQ